MNADEMTGILHIAEFLETGGSGHEAAERLRLLTISFLPCPCCGSPAECVDQGKLRVIRCTECGLATPAGLVDDVNHIWNRRTINKEQEMS